MPAMYPREMRNATNPMSSSKVLTKLANSTIWFVQEAAIANPSTPLEALMALATSEDVAVRRKVAYKTVKPEVLAHLAADASEVVRSQVAVSRYAPAATRAVLAQDADANVRRCVAACHETPTDILAALATDICDLVRCAVAANWSTPSETLSTFATDPWHVARECAAKQLASRA